VLTQCLEQFWARYHIPVFASLAALDVNHHALAIDVADFQVRQFSASYSGGVERHQQNVMEGSARSLDQSCDFFLAEDRWQAMGPFRIGSVGDAPGSRNEFWRTGRVTGLELLVVGSGIAAALCSHKPRPFRFLLGTGFGRYLIERKISVWTPPVTHTTRQLVRSAIDENGDLEHEA